MKFFVTLSLALCLSSCSVYMAANQEDKKDLTVLNQGTPRSLVLGKLGQPVSSEKENGKRKDYFNFTQGYTGGTKAARAVGHGVMDVLTLGIWEIVGTPVEGAADGQKMTIEVNYDQQDKIEEVKVFEDGKLIKVLEGEVVRDTEKEKNNNDKFKSKIINK